MNDRINRILKTEMKSDATVDEIERLHGDASYRTYYRAKLSDGTTMILMQMPEGKSSVSEEITNFEGKHEEIPYINVDSYLREHDIPVPEIFYYSEKDLLMFLEDLGDTHLYNLVEGAGEATTLNWYRRAIDLLIKIQKRTISDPGGRCIAFKRSFDEGLLNWEFDHFLEYGIETREDITPEEEDLKTFKTVTRSISNEIVSMPKGLTLRDYQSRNLLIKDDELHLIDFQDALIGPQVYDLVSLTRDSYVKLKEHAVDELVKYYSDKAGRNPEILKREFDLVTVQRKLKDAGRFVYIDHVKKNANYLKFIPTSLGYVRGALERLPEYKTLYDMLAKYVPELQ